MKVIQDGEMHMDYKLLLQFVIIISAMFTGGITKDG